MVIYVASYPRSGNTFFRILINRILGKKTYAVDVLFDQLGITDVIGHEPIPGTIAELNARDDLYFVKTHDLPSDDLPAIYLMRDGRDAVVSFARWFCSFQPDQSVQGKLKRLLGRESFDAKLKEVIEGTLFGGWSNNVLAWARDRKAGATSVVRFEELISDPLSSFERALSELRVPRPVSSVTSIPTFEELNQLAPEFFRKGRTGGWRQEMAPELCKLFWSIHRQGMEFCQYGSGDDD